jgi:hypothetical protein
VRRASGEQRARGRGQGLRLRRPLRVLFGLSLAVLASCNPFPETWEWNQKLTVEVATPGGVRSGAAVTNVRWQEVNSTGNYPGSYRGEASIVDLGDERFLFALIGEDTRYLALRTFRPVLGKDSGVNERGFATMARFRGTRDVPREAYPLLVTFTDINDPKTVKRVDPANLAAIFGPGVSLRRITLEITDEKATEDQIDSYLPWYCDLQAKRLRLSGVKGPISDNELANNIGIGEFGTGDCL